MTVLAAAALAGCSGGADGGPAPATADPAPITAAACGLTLDEVSLYQGVEVVLGRRAGTTPVHETPVIANRPALLRAFVTPAGPGPVAVSGRVTVSSAAGTQTFASQRTIELGDAPSTRAALGSTVNFALPASALTTDAAISVELDAPTACPGGPAARFPDSGDRPLHALDTGTLRVSLVPIRYDSDGSGRLPDTSPEQLQRFRETLQAELPFGAIQLDVHAPVATKIAVTADGGWTALLESIRDLRAREAPSERIYYYGLVEPAPSASSYCLGPCIGGISYVAGPGDVGLRAGVGVGYPGLATADSMAHELGHLHGRPHAPCGSVSNPDRSYPYAGGVTGGWGLDPRGAGTLEPPDSKDVMSYCAPRWISDYTFGAVATRAAQVDAGVAQALHVGAPGDGRMALVDRAGGSSWGLPAATAPPGAPVPASLVDGAGTTVGSVDVWPVPLADGDGAAYWVPRAGLPPGAFLQLPGSARPLPVGDESAVAPLAP